MTTDVSPVSPSVRCRWCSADVPVVAGLLELHAQAPAPAFIAALAGVVPGAPCPLSLTVPWRAGKPDEAWFEATLRRAVGQGGRTFVIRHLNWEKVAADYEGLLLSLAPASTA